MAESYAIRTVKNGLESAYAQDGVLLRFMQIGASQALDLNNKARKESKLTQSPSKIRKINQLSSCLYMKYVKEYYN